MDTEKMKIPEREIREDEHELLDHMWSTIVGQHRYSDQHGFEDVEKRIHRQLRRGRIFRLGWISGAAVIAMAVALFLNQPDVPPATEAYAQLKQMGVTVDRPEVVLTADDGMSMTLDSAARIEQQAAGEVALQTASGKQKIAPERRLKVEVPAGRQFHMTLADGSQVWLNAGSTLEYPATFDNSPERRVRLTGEAFFDVAHNQEQPFLVELGTDEVIRVLGTSFNVNAYSGTGRHVTTLVEGKVAYAAADSETHLRPNEQLCLDCATGQTAINRVDASVFGAWKDGWLWFEAEKLTALTTRMSRIYGITIVVDDRFRDYSFSGKIRQERGIDYILNLVTETTPITCEVEDGIIYLK